MKDAKEGGAGINMAYSKTMSIIDSTRSARKEPYQHLQEGDVHSSKKSANSNENIYGLAHAKLDVDKLDGNDSCINYVFKEGQMRY